MRHENENSLELALAEVIDFQHARARREEAARKANQEAERQAREATDRAEARRCQREAHAEASRQLAAQCAAQSARQRQEITARFEQQAQDRLARIDAENALEITRLRLEYAKRANRSSGRAWVASTLLVVVIAVVGAVAFVVGVSGPALADPANASTTGAVAVAMSYEAVTRPPLTGVIPSPVAKRPGKVSGGADVTAASRPETKPQGHARPNRPRAKVHPPKPPKPPKPPVHCGSAGALGCLYE